MGSLSCYSPCRRTLLCGLILHLIPQGQSVPHTPPTPTLPMPWESLTRAHWQCLNHRFSDQESILHLTNTYTHYPVATDLNCCRSQSMLAFDSAEKNKKQKNRGPRRERHVTDSVHILEIDLRLPCHPCCQAKTHHHCEAVFWVKSKDFSHKN